jgi:nucleolar protein 6
MSAEPLIAAAPAVLKNNTKKRTKFSETEAGKKQKAKGWKAKYIVFIGNLNYLTTVDKLAEHFYYKAIKIEERLIKKQLRKEKKKPEKKEKTPFRNPDILSIRLGVDQVTKKPKGYAFMEFKTAKALQKALLMHHTELGGREINVELTLPKAGKAGKAKRKIRLVERNVELNEQRKKRFKKDKAKSDAEKKQVAAAAQMHV